MEAEYGLEGSVQSPYQELRAKHNKEKKDLLAKITCMKHSVPKTDKKRWKEIGTEIENLEKDLKERQEKEFCALVSTMKISERSNEKVVTGDESKVAKEGRENLSKISKAVKRREKKMQMQRKLNKATEEDAEASKFAPGTLETESINKTLLSRNLRLYEIPPNGDCLFNAVAHQLSHNSESITKITGKDVRKKAATYIRTHKEDFLPFLTWNDGSPIEEIEFEKYCWQIESTSEEGGQWGGEPELRAISNVFERRIEVLQPEGRVAVFGEQFITTRPLMITYHRQAYSLGEHYNSTVLNL